MNMQIETTIVVDMQSTSRTIVTLDNLVRSYTEVAGTTLCEEECRHS
jgi:hypothetical protein